MFFSIVARSVVTTPQEMKGKSLTVNFLSSVVEKTTSEVKVATEAEEVTGSEEKTDVRNQEVDGSPETERLPETELKTEGMRQLEERAIAGKILQSVSNTKLCINWRLFLKGAVSYFTHMLLRITNLKALGQCFQV